MISRDIRFQYMAGTINREDSDRFKRIIFRVTRGMTWTALIDIEQARNNNERNDLNHLLENAAGNIVDKTVFFIVFQGGAHEMMRNKLNKICESFSAARYNIPEDPHQFEEKVNEVDTQLIESVNIIRVTKNHIEVSLDYFANPRKLEIPYSYIEEIRLFLRKEKSIYFNLNMLKLQGVVLHGFCWCPLDSLDDVKKALGDLIRKKPDIAGVEFTQITENINSTPPTRFRTNDITGPFQAIVDTYGVPRYREINPGLFTVATFPFLFGVMFGDIGHGGLLLILGVYLIFNKESLQASRQPSVYKSLLPARYVLAFFGLAASYCGWIYNDFMAISLNIFGSCYEVNFSTMLNVSMKRSVIHMLRLLIVSTHLVLIRFGEMHKMN
jgi:V-type H+-transporting ATPase subunit a